MQKMCVASVVPVTRSVIPDSDGFWFCGEWQYSCNPYPTLPSKANTCKSVLMGLLCFCIFLPILVWCCFMIRLCFFVINVAPNKKLQKKVQNMLGKQPPAGGHDLRGDGEQRQVVSTNLDLRSLRQARKRQNAFSTLREVRSRLLSLLRQSKHLTS